MFFAKAQTLSPNVTPTQGDYYTSGSGSLSWTMGETYTATYITGSNILSQGFEQPEINIITGSLTGPFCAGGSISIPFTADGFVDGANVYTAQLSDASGSFASPVSLGTLNSTAISGTISGTIPLNTTAGTGYLVRITGSAPVFTGKSSPTVVTVTAPVLPTVSIDPTPNYIVCTGSTIHFTATITNGGTSPGYQWQINGSNVTGTGNTFTTSTPVDGAVVTCILTSNATCASPASVTSNATTMIVGACNNVWIGNTSDWFTASNWTAGVVPANCADGANFPPLTSPHVYPILTANASVGNVILQQGATVTLGNYNLSVCGNWFVTNSTTIASTGGLVIFNGISPDSTQTISGATNTYEINVNTADNAGVVLATGAAVTVSNALDLQKGNLDVSRGSFTFTSSSPAQVAILDNFSSGYTGTINGTIKAERGYVMSTYIPTHQHMLGAPVGGALLAQFGAGSVSGQLVPSYGCDEDYASPNSPYGNVFALIEANGTTCGMDQWFVEPGTQPAVPGTGYSVILQNSGTLTVSGSPNTAASYQLTGLGNSNWSNLTNEHHTLTSGWHLVSNPYLATLQLTTANTGIQGQVQIWNATGPYVGTYQPGIVGQTSATIAPFQAYMVHVGTPNTTASYTINGTDRKRIPSTFYAQNANELDIQAENLQNHLLDKTVVAFNSAATDSFDAQFDANKVAGSNSRHSLYTTLPSGTWMGINTLHDIAATSTVPMGFEAGANADYSLAFGNLNSFDPTTYIMLEDLQQHSMYNVRNGNYQFSADTGDNWNRFILHFTPPAVIAQTDPTCSTPGTISVTQPGTANWNYTLTDAGNTVIASGILNQSSSISQSAPAGTYTLTLTDNNNYTVTKVIQLSGAQPVAAAFSAVTAVNTQTAVTFTNASQNANSYSWNFGDGSISSLVNPVHTYIAPGTYTVELTANNTTGCTASSNQTITVTNNATGITGLTENGINLWSNKNKVYVDFTGAGNDVNAVIKIYDVLGQVISEDRFTLNGLYQKELDDVEAAYVIVAVKNNDKVTTRKLFITNIVK